MHINVINKIFVAGNSGAGFAPPAASSSDMITQEDTNFVSGMNPSITESEIHSHFGAIGIIKVNSNVNSNKFCETNIGSLKIQIV